MSRLVKLPRLTLEYRLGLSQPKMKDSAMFSPTHFIQSTLEWVDVFSGVTGLKPSESTWILSELLGNRDVTQMFGSIAENEAHLGSLPARDASAICRNLEENFDENIDDDEQGSRFSFYRAVLHHHGFSTEFYAQFRRHLSPTSGEEPRMFSMDKKEMLRNGFNPEPFQMTNDEGDDEESPFEDLMSMMEEGGGSFFESLRLSKPVEPIGWKKLLDRLGFEIKDVDPIPAEPWYPKFFAYKDAVRHPVFVAGPSKLPFDDDDDLTTYIKEEIRKHTLINKHDVPLLFWSTPVTSGDDNLPYWGEVQFENKWYEMFMSDKVKTVPDIVKVSKIMSKHSEQGYKEASALLDDKDLKLVGFFMDNHVDPLTKVFESMMPKFNE